MAAEIKFGTSGWRAIVAEEFTFGNIRRAVTGIAQYVASQAGPKTVLVGRDPRFLGEMFVAEAAKVLAAHGVTPVIIPEAAPTPAIAYAVRQRKTGGSINFTASHNPPEYNGIKFSTPDGAPALPEVTHKIEANVKALKEVASPAETAAKYEQVDVKPDYLKRLGELVDFKAIEKSGLKVVVDPFWGAGRGYASDISARAWRGDGDGARLSRCVVWRACAGARWGVAERVQGEDEGDGRGDRDCDGWGRGPVRDCGWGWDVYPAELHHRAACSIIWWSRGDGRMALRSRWRPRI
jgi:hypothetical protein